MEYLKKKSGGCSSMNYAGVSDNYMLYDKALVPTTGGKKSKAKKPKTKKKRMGVKKTKGGVFMDNMASATSNLLSSMQQNLPTTTPTTTPSTTTKGGSRRGGMFPTNLTDTMNNLLQNKGGSKAKGGAVELAPFAAALAFLATRFATDKSFKLKDIFGRKKSSKTKSAVKSKSKSLA